jgi:hypothetical protein
MDKHPRIDALAKEVGCDAMDFAITQAKDLLDEMDAFIASGKDNEDVAQHGGMIIEILVRIYQRGHSDGIASTKH